MKFLSKITYNNLTIIKQNLQKIFVVQDNGIVDLPCQSGIDVELSSNQIIPSGVWTKICYDSVKKDRQSEYDISNFKYEAKSVGVYMISACVSLIVDTNVDTFTPDISGNKKLAIFKNGVSTNREIDFKVSTYAYGEEFSSNVVPLNENFTTAIDLEEGDYLEIFCFNGNEALTTVLPLKTWLTILKLT
jgi:hypothetical protein